VDARAGVESRVEGRGGLSRLGFAAGAAWVVAILVGNSLTEAGAPAGGGGDAALAYFARFDGGGPLLGVSLELFGFALLVVFLGRLHAALRDAEGPGGWWSGVALVGGVTTLAVKLATVAPVVAGIAAAETLAAPQALLLQQIGDAGFLISALTSGLLVLGAAASALSSGLLPRPLAWAGVPIGLLAVLGSLRPTSLEGGPGVPGFLLGLLWLAAVSLLLAWRDPAARQGAGQQAVLAPA
jgi:hypothetical protein